MERKQPTASEDPIQGASYSSTSPHRDDFGGGTQRPKGNGHDVFLSCKWKTISESFSQDLYTSLVHAGIDTFYCEHQSSRKMGSGILDGLRQSKISIPIFSPYYAFSQSGLRELVHMLKCKRSSEQVVLPIFYGVRPSVVQHVEGRFRQAFSRYEGRVDKMELGEWRTALVEVGSLRGWATENFAYGNEGAVIKLVVTRVVSLLKRTFKLPKELVGIDDHVKYIMSSLDPKYNDTRIIGICGVRGSGKTTLAKILWNNLSGDFEHLSFVPNIQDVSLRMGIEFLQEELICDIQRSPHTVSNVNEGIGIIKSLFTSKKVLVILDDINDDIHIDALVGDGSWLKAGSIVIMTTRNKNILDKACACLKLELNELTLDQALTLFSRHLFEKNAPPEAYEKISRGVVSGMPSIPLLLELTCSSFRQKQEEVWLDTFEKLRDDVYNKNMQEPLRITYEILNYEQQQIFLDIACFFIGSSKQNPTYMWDSCGFLPNKGIEVLRNMSLIEIDKDNKLTMHDHLRNFGKEIIHLEDRKGFQQRSRLWIYEEALEVLYFNEGRDKIQAICLDKYDPKRSYTSKKFRRLTNLRSLKVCGANFVGDFKGLLSQLRWLHWECCPSNFQAANFHPKQLVVLNLSRSEISEDWKGWDPIKTAKKLKVLNLSSCSPLKRIPDLSAFESLEILILEKCENLEKIDPSIEDIKSLISLNVSGCTRMEELPNEVNTLKELKELLINDTAIREIPILADGLMKLETLNASCCRRLEKLPAEVGRMEELRKLLINDTAIREIPMSGKGLMKLETLNASCCGRLEELPIGVARMEELRELLINDTAIREIPMLGKGLMKLETLNASCCGRLEKLPAKLGRMEELRELLINDTAIRKIPMSGDGLMKLETLNASCCGRLKELPTGLGRMKELRELLIKDTAIREIPISGGGLRRLKTLRASYCEELAQFSNSIDSLVSLSQLDLSHSGIEKLPESMVFPKSLTWLNLSYSWIEKLPKSLDSLVSLTHLDLSHSGIREFPESLSSLKSLTQLDLSHSGIEELPKSMGFLCVLTHLNLSYLGIKQLPKSLNYLVSLTQLDLSHSKIGEFPESLSSLVKLTQLDLSHTRIKELPESMDSLKALTHLNLSYLGIKQLPKFLNSLVSLTQLNLSHSGIEEFPETLSSLVKLTQLDLSYTRIEELPESIDSLKALTHLNLSYLGIKQLLESIDYLVSLQHLLLKGCYLLRHLPNSIRKLTSLTHLDLQSTRIVELPHGMRNLKNLKILDIRGTDIRRLPMQFNFAQRDPEVTLEPM